MRLQGKITRWNEERGFGFISSLSDENSVFVHIKAFSQISHLPQVGDLVSYELVKDKNGKARAEKVRFSDQSKIKNRSNHQHQDNLLPVFFAALFVCFILVAVFVGGIFWPVVVVYSVMSLLTFATYAWDKFSAQRGNWRTPESTLHILALVGGWLGAIAAQRLLRHKSNKKEFLFIFWVTVFLNVVGICCLVWIGSSGFN